MINNKVKDILDEINSYDGSGLERVIEERLEKSLQEYLKELKYNYNYAVDNHRLNNVIKEINKWSLI